MKKFRTAIVQYDTPTPDIEYNSQLAERLILEAETNGADIVLFPECFLTAYAAPDICERSVGVPDCMPLDARNDAPHVSSYTAVPRFDEILSHPDFIRWRENAISESDESFTRLCRLAAELQINLVLTGFSKGRRLPQNTAWIIDRGGNVALKYSKVHTCAFDWERFLEPGDSFPVCTLDGISVGVMICYDREYPESARELMLGGAELILHPSSCGEMPPRLNELACRAMENMVYIAMANAPGPKMGNSCAYDPMVFLDGKSRDNTIFIGGELDETIYYVDFDLDELRRYRQTEDIGKYRRPQAYIRLGGKKIEQL